MTEEMLWQIFIDEAEPEQEFADTAHDNKKAIVKALVAVYNKAVQDCKISVNENKIWE